jgi:hypothetical protein
MMRVLALLRDGHQKTPQTKRTWQPITARLIETRPPDRVSMARACISLTANKIQAALKSDGRFSAISFKCLKAYVTDNKGLT